MNVEKIIYEKSNIIKSAVNFPLFYLGARMFIRAKYREDKVTKISYLYALDLVKHVYSKKSKKIMMNIFAPSEIFYALDMYPLLPEVAAGFLAAFGLIRRALSESEAILGNSDVCSVHKGVVGLSKLKIFPTPDFLVSYTKPCFSPVFSFALTKDLNGGEIYIIDSYEDIDYLASQIEMLYYNLTKRLGVKDGINRLKKAITLSNEAYKYFEEIKDLRREYVVMDGKNFLDYAGMIFSVFGSKYGVEFFKSLRDEIKERIKRRDIIEPKVRLYWMHLGPYFKTDFFQWLNSKGAYIVFEESTSISWEKLDMNNPFESLARKLVNLRAFSTLEDRINTALENVEKYKADGVIIFNQWGCRQGSVPAYIIRQKLVSEGIPSIVIDGDLVDELNFPKEQIKTRVEAFLEVIS
ncbi:MAG: 2-hydroxyacyl-CoA dehydratase family protein [Dictyoglomus thermophilum]